MTQLKGVAVEGGYIANLDEDKRWFVMLAEPRYEMVQDLDNPNETKEKLIVFVELSDGSKVDYFPNKTSQKMMASIYGYDMSKWLGKKFYWGIADQKVRGQDKKVLFVLNGPRETNGQKKKR